MSDTGEDYRALDNYRKALRDRYGAPCPMCLKHLPKANPSILMPQGWCRIHDYRDSRPYLTDEERSMS